MPYLAGQLPFLLSQYCGFQVATVTRNGALKKLPILCLVTHNGLWVATTTT